MVITKSSYNRKFYIKGKGYINLDAIADLALTYNEDIKIENAHTGENITDKVLLAAYNKVLSKKATFWSPLVKQLIYDNINR